MMRGIRLLLMASILLGLTTAAEAVNRGGKLIYARYADSLQLDPVLTDANAAQQELALYVASKAVFTQPSSKEPYQPNSAVSGKRLAEVAKPEKTAVFYETKASADGTRGVLFLDGHVERVPEAVWPRLKQASQSP